MRQSTKPIIEKFESLFSNFNEKFYENKLQQPIITISSRGRKNAYGWCTSWKTWSDNSSLLDSDDIQTVNTTGFYEINICSEFLARPFEELSTTLLHEMVHLYNLQIGVPDCSRSGTYHNKNFKTVAENHGLIVEKSQNSGWANTVLSDKAKIFVNSIPIEDITLFRKEQPKSKSSPQSTRIYVCPKCKTIVRATKVVHIICSDCGIEFIEKKILKEIINNHRN